MHHLTYGISSLLHSVNLIVFMLLLDLDKTYSALVFVHFSVFIHIF